MTSSMRLPLWALLIASLVCFPCSQATAKETSWWNGWFSSSTKSSKPTSKSKEWQPPKSTPPWVQQTPRPKSNPATKKSDSSWSQATASTKEWWNRVNGQTTMKGKTASSRKPSSSKKKKSYWPW
ncbi:MAG: hypothetical protein ACK43N_19280 [Pirellulaceae bacterium]